MLLTLSFVMMVFASTFLALRAVYESCPIMILHLPSAVHTLPNGTSCLKFVIKLARNAFFPYFYLSLLTICKQARLKAINFC